MLLSVGWLLNVGRHTISRAIQAAGASGRDHSRLYRFFSRAVWLPDRAGWLLFQLLLAFVPGNVLLLIVDDTLCRKSGPHIWGAGMHHDPLNSSYGRGQRRAHKAFAFGHNWVTLALWVPWPWQPQHGVALPFLLRLYRSKKRCPAEKYRKRTELALELVRLVRGWLPPDKRLYLTGDAEYACKTLVRQLPAGMHFIGPMARDAALYETRLPQKKSRGRRPRKGRRLPSPRQLAELRSCPWRACTVFIYGREVEVLLKSQIVLWYTVAGPRPVRLVLTRDPRGRIEDRAYFSTDPALAPGEILGYFSRRWTLEVTYHNVKEHLGLEEPQNGWWRRPAGSRPQARKAGPQPQGNRGSLAVERTVPFIFLLYGVVHVWYFRRGVPAREVKWVKRFRPWQTTKAGPAFPDLLRAIRRDFLLCRFSAYPQLLRVLRNSSAPLMALLQAA
jgi:hypothetical protein